MTKDGQLNESSTKREIENRFSNARRVMDDLCRRTPRGVRGLKFNVVALSPQRRGSHPSRGAWIEIPL